MTTEQKERKANRASTKGGLSPFRGVGGGGSPRSTPSYPTIFLEFPTMTGAYIFPEFPTFIPLC